MESELAYAGYALARCFRPCGRVATTSLRPGDGGVASLSFFIDSMAAVASLACPGIYYTGRAREQSSINQHEVSIRNNIFYIYIYTHTFIIKQITLFIYEFN